MYVVMAEEEEEYEEEEIELVNEEYEYIQNKTT